jgi:RNA polymerase sigma-70 factor, ECF subfamily
MDRNSHDESYAGAAAEYGPALERLARSYEADPAERRDLLQEIHFALWRSFAGFDGRCSLRTWIYRVAHNTASSHVSRRKRTAKGVSIEELELADAGAGPEDIVSEQQMLEKLMAMIRALKPFDAQIMLLYLEDLDAAEIGEIAGISAGAVAAKIHRIKTLMAKQFHTDGGRT